MGNRPHAVHSLAARRQQLSKLFGCELHFGVGSMIAELLVLGEFSCESLAASVLKLFVLEIY